MPIFSSTPARITLPAVGASVCASGSQVWNGNIGTLIAKARAKARNISVWARPAGSTNCARAGRSKVYVPVAAPYWKYRARMATSMRSEPASV